MEGKEEDGSGLSREQIAKWTRKIRAAFKIFDKDDKNAVVAEEVRHNRFRTQEFSNPYFRSTHTLFSYIHI